MGCLRKIDSYALISGQMNSLLKAIKHEKNPWSPVTEYTKKRKLGSRRRRAEFLDTCTRPHSTGKMTRDHKGINDYIWCFRCFRLLTTCDKVLIEHHLEIFHSEFQKLLNADKNEDLGRMSGWSHAFPTALKS